MNNEMFQLMSDQEVTENSLFQLNTNQCLEMTIVSQEITVIVINVLRARDFMTS